MRHPFLTSPKLGQRRPQSQTANKNVQLKDKCTKRPDSKRVGNIFNQNISLCCGSSCGGVECGKWYSSDMLRMIMMIMKNIFILSSENDTAFGKPEINSHVIICRVGGCDVKQEEGGGFRWKANRILRFSHTKRKTFSFDFLLVMFLFCKNRKYIVSCIKRSVYLSALSVLLFMMFYAVSVIAGCHICWFCCSSDFHLFLITNTTETELEINLAKNEKYSSDTTWSHAVDEWMLG